MAAPGAPADHALLRDRGRGIQGERHPVLRHAADQLPGRARRPAAPRLPGGVPQAARGPRRHRQARRNPGESEEDALKRLDETWARQPSSLDSPLYTAIGEAAAETYPGAVFAPALFEAGTSLGPWTSKGVPGYGVYPYVLDNDQLIAMHGNDERITVEALKQGTEFMYRLFDRFRVR